MRAGDAVRRPARDHPRVPDTQRHEQVRFRCDDCGLSSGVVHEEAVVVELRRFLVDHQGCRQSVVIDLTGPSTGPEGS